MSRHVPPARAEQLRDAPALPCERRVQRRPRLLHQQLRARDGARVAFGERQRMPRIGLVAAGRSRSRGPRCPRAPRRRRTGACAARFRSRRPPRRDARARPCAGAGTVSTIVAPDRRHAAEVIRAHETVDAAAAQRARERLPARAVPAALWPRHGVDAGVISASAATRSGCSLATRTAVCAPIETPASSARSTPVASSTAMRSAARCS